MSMLFPPLVSFLHAYGYPLLFLITFIAAAGAPLPMGLLLLAAGALWARGNLDVILMTAITASASVAGDCVGYLIGRSWGTRALDWLPRSRLGKRFISARAIERSRVSFQRHGGLAILLTRVFVSALGGVTNLVAGAESFPLRAFLFYDFVGESLSAGSTLGLGFAAGASWEAAGDTLGVISLVVIGLVCVGIAIQRLSRELRRGAPNRLASSGGASDGRASDGTHVVPRAIIGAAPLLRRPVPDAFAWRCAARRREATIPYALEADWYWGSPLPRPGFHGVLWRADRARLPGHPASASPGE